MAKLNIFVACPYTVFPLDDYKRVFQTVSRSLSVTFKFADEKITNQFILNKVTEYIRSNDISFFDITGWNPNVSLELGIAIGLGKRYFILLNSKMDGGAEVPSDIRGIERIQYVSNSELEAKIILLVQQELENVKGKSDSAFIGLKEKIIEILDKNQGSNLSEIVRESNEDQLLIQATIRSMTLSGDLKTYGERRGMRYYTANYDLRKVSNASKKKVKEIEAVEPYRKPKTAKRPSGKPSGKKRSS